MTDPTTTTPSSAGGATPPKKQAPLDVHARISRVTVFEDRADVLREGKVTLPAGSSVVRVVDLPILLSDDHIIARIEPVGDAGAAHVNDTRVERIIVDAKASADGKDELEKRRIALHKEIEAIDDEVAVAEDNYRRARHERVRAEGSLRRYSELAMRSAGRGELSTEAMKASVQALATKLVAADAARAKAREALDVLKKKRVKMAEDLRPRPTGQKTVAELLLRVSSATGGAYRVVITNLTACAAWRPTHDAFLEAGEGGKRVRFVSHAAVWNRTGEAWSDVDLVFSTARPSAGAELPSLRADRLTLRQKTAEERKTIVVQHREESVPKSATEGTAPGVDDGGEARVFTASKVTVKDDGRPQRVEIASFTAPCNVERVAFPEVAPQVFLRASLKNAGAGPILAGAVTLSMDGTYVGVGDVSFVGAGESFDLSFGSDDRFTVRTKKRRVDDKKLVGKDVVHFIREAVLSQTGKSNERVVVHLRLPVSEVKQLRVLNSPQHSTVTETADEHGIVRVPVDLAPNVEKKLVLAFTFDTSGDVRIPDPW